MSHHPELTGYGGDLGPAAGTKVPPRGAIASVGKSKNIRRGPTPKGYDAQGLRTSSAPGSTGLPAGKPGPKTSTARATGDGSQSTAVNVGSGAFTEGP